MEAEIMSEYRMSLFMSLIHWNPPILDITCVIKLDQSTEEVKILLFLVGWPEFTLLLVEIFIKANVEQSINMQALNNIFNVKQTWQLALVQYIPSTYILIYSCYSLHHKHEAVFNLCFVSQLDLAS
jgi:hypothetical protein